jgi:aconitate hydratase
VLAARGGSVEALPYCLRVVVENIARHEAQTGADATAALAALACWPERTDVSLPLMPERVILPDSSGLPVLLDLASLRDAVALRGGDASSIKLRVPVDFVIDHSLQVDRAGEAAAMAVNLAREFERNDERYRFVKWAQASLGNLRVFPPGTGIIHQVNLERIATVVTAHGDAAFPDFVLGGDSHTTMINGLGVLGWGIGGLDAEAVLLGYPNTIAMPRVVGVRLTGCAPAGSTTTDVALLVTARLRAHGVTAKFVEFHGEAADAMSVPERATLANMAPEYGATVGFFAVDGATLAYLRATGRSAEHVTLVESYCRANALWREPSGARTPLYSEEVVIDLADAEPTVAGPKQPHDRLPLSRVAADFRERLVRDFGAAGDGIPHGRIVIASITSCTNTSNPSVMIAAGLLARNAVARGLRPPSWVKTSLAPGSQVVPRYLAAAGLLAPLEGLGFHVVGYGCATCGGKSGPLAPEVVEAIERDGLVAATVLSGNRNFEGRIHRLARANYLCSPPLVVAYALAGRIDIDLTREPLGHDREGVPLMLSDLWPDACEIERYRNLAEDPALFEHVYRDSERGPPQWRDLDVTAGERFEWDPASTYLVPPPFLAGVISGEPLPREIAGVRVLALFGDSVTTDHISPSGEIPASSAAGRYLASLGIPPASFNTYVGRRCNHEVMARATFANVRIRNQLAGGEEGGVTLKFPEGTAMTMYDAARAYAKQCTPLLVLAGRDYGAGSSRDWAAKGTALLGVRAVVAESFERIHRANLVCMGVIPLRFATNEGWHTLGLDGSETYVLRGLREAVFGKTAVEAEATGAKGVVKFALTADIHTDVERHFLQAGGMLPSVLAELDVAR